MKRILLFAVVLVSLAAPLSAHAEDCQGLLCFLWNGDMGFTDRAKIQADVDIKAAEQNRLAQIDLANINAQKEQGIANAKAELERQRQAGLISVAEEKRKADDYKALVDAWQRNSQAAIEQQYGTQRTAIESQTNLGMNAITQVGQTQRLSMEVGMVNGSVFLILLTIVVLGLARMVNRRQVQPVVYLTSEQYPRLSERHNRIDTTYVLARKEDER